MTGYPKIWTSIMNDPWFVSLPAIGRAIFLQLIIVAKLGGDTGEICTRSIPTLATTCGTDRKTMWRWLGKFDLDRKIIIEEKSPTLIRLRIANYLKWQGVKKYSEREYVSQPQGQSQSKNPSPKQISKQINNQIRRVSKKNKEREDEEETENPALKDLEHPLGISTESAEETEINAS